MSKHNLKFILSFGGLSLVSFLARAETLNVYNRGGNYILEFCDSSKGGADYSIKKTTTKERITNGKLNSGGCVDAELKGVSDGESLTLFINGQPHPFAIPSTAPVTGQTGNQSGSANQNQKNKKDLADLNKVTQVASQQARRAANEQAQKYGGYLNKLYNFVSGYVAGLNLNVNSLAAEAQYQIGSSEGLAAGTSVGLEKGKAEGLAQGQTNATKSVLSQYTAALDSDTAKFSATADTALPAFGGIPGSINLLVQSEDISRTTEQKNKIIYAFNKLDGSDLGQKGLEAIITGNRNFVNLYPEDYGAYYQWRLFQNNPQDQFYPNLAKKDNGEEAQSLFKDTFISEYQRVIDDKVETKLKDSRPDVYASAKALGQEVILQQQRNKGYSQSYRVAHLQSSQDGFAKTYAGAYEKAFRAKTTELDNTVSIQGIKAKIVDEQGGQAFVIGRPVSLVIEEIVNIGQRAGAVGVTVSGALDGQSTLEVKKLSRNKNIVLKDFARISSNASLGTQDVSIRIGGYTLSVKIDIVWANQIKALGTVTDQESVTFLSQFVEKGLVEEWKGFFADKSFNVDNMPYDSASTQRKVKAQKMEDFQKVVSSIKTAPAIAKICADLNAVYGSMKNFDAYIASGWGPHPTKQPEKYQKEKDAYDTMVKAATEDPFLNKLVSEGCKPSLANGGAGKAQSCVGLMASNVPGDMRMYSGAMSAVQQACK